jgi:hypothetical protein
MIEEGEPCPTECGGVLIFPPVKNCSCHIRSPCSACVENKLACSECGWTQEEEEEITESWRDRPSLL